MVDVSHAEHGGRDRQGKAGWEAIISSAVAIGSFVFGVFTWWDSRAHQEPKPAESRPAEKVVAPAPGPATEPKPAEATADPAFAPHTFALSNGDAFSYYRNLALDVPHPGVTRAIIAIPNFFPVRVGDFYRGLVDLARRAGRARDTLILVPLYQTSPAGLRPGEPHWPRGWEIGASSAGERPISSFQVLDELFGPITDPRHFPDLRTVVVAGNSSAGNFVNRYVAGGRPMFSGSGERGPVDVHYVIMGASSYLYLDRLRPVAGTDRFEAPDASACPDFHNYRYGLDKRNSYMARLSTKALRANMFSRRATYVVGEADTGDEKLDKTGAAMLQGANRFERAANYANYIGRFPEWREHVTFRVLRGAGHASLIASEEPEILDLLFGPRPNPRP